MKKDKKGKKDASLEKKGPLLIMGTILMFFFLAILGLAIFIYQLLYNSDYFLIKEGRVQWVKEPLAIEPYQNLLNKELGQNIFKFDIYSKARQIHTAHPELKNIWIVRDFPDRLTLKIEPRVPIAQVGEEDFFLIDEEGVILTQARKSIREGLPIITGVGWRLFRRVGQKEDSLRMSSALSLLQAVDESDFLANHTLSKIDVSDYRNISFFIEDGLEVKIGHSNFKERLESLDRVLSSIEANKSEIRYIDLRFDDVVFGTE